jgi:hypothetical protein
VVNTVNWVLLVEVLDLCEQTLPLWRVSPAFGELVWGSRRSMLESRPDSALRRRTHRSEKVGVGLGRRTLESKTFEVAARFVDVSEVDLATFVQDNDFVKEPYRIRTACGDRSKMTHIVRCLRRLIDCNASRGTKDVALCTQRSAKLNGVGGVEASCRVVPALQRSIAECSLGDGDSFALTAADSSHKIISHFGVDRVAYAKHGHYNLKQKSAWLSKKPHCG